MITLLTHNSKIMSTNWEENNIRWNTTSYLSKPCKTKQIMRVFSPGGMSYKMAWVVSLERYCFHSDNQHNLVNVLHMELHTSRLHMNFVLSSSHLSHKTQNHVLQSIRMETIPFQGDNSRHFIWHASWREHSQSVFVNMEYTILQRNIVLLI
jgi:hypothetical protein